MSSRHRILDSRSKTVKVSFPCLSFLTLLLFIQPVAAQQKETPLITFRQKMLREKHDDNVEKIDSFAKLHLMIAGNIYQTEKHAAYAYDVATGKYDYKSELKYIQPILNLGDVTMANLKTSFSNSTKNMFSSPDEFGLALKYAGVNVALHANVHTANISKTNLKRTDDVLDEYDILHTGAFQDNIQRNGNYPLIINKKGFRIALLNYTNLTSRPTISRDFVINEIDKTVIDRDMRFAHANKPDFIIVYFDWGSNMQDIPSYAQQELAQYVFQAGANLVVGTHPNTPMRIDLMNYSYNGQLREGIIAYSLGNLVSSNEEIRNRNGYIIDMEIQKNNFTTETHVSDWGVIPVYTYYDTTAVRGKTKVYSVPCANVESGDIFPGLAYIEKRRAVNSAYEVRKLLGTTADEIQYNLNELVVNNVMETIDITNAPLNNKYNPKREEELKPSDAPELPVTSSNPNNPPSLLMLYGQPTEIKTNTLVSKTENSYLTHKKNAEAIMEAGIGVNETPDAQNSVVDNSTHNSGAAINQNNSAAENASTATNKKALIENNEVVEKDKKKTAAEVEADAKAKKEIAAVTGSNPKQKDQSVNTNYHTTGNDYDLNDPANTARKKSITAATVKEKAKESGVEFSPTNTTGISTGISGSLTGNVEMTKAKNLDLQIDTFYRIQFYALKTFIPLDTNYYTHLKGYEVRVEDGLYKYMLGKYRSFEECERYWKGQIQPRYKQSFIVKFVDGKRILK